MSVRYSVAPMEFLHTNLMQIVSIVFFTMQALAKQREVNGAKGHHFFYALTLMECLHTNLTQKSVTLFSAAPVGLGEVARSERREEPPFFVLRADAHGVSAHKSHPKLCPLFFATPVGRSEAARSEANGGKRVR